MVRRDPRGSIALCVLLRKENDNDETRGQLSLIIFSQVSRTRPFSDSSDFILDEASGWFRLNGRCIIPGNDAWYAESSLNRKDPSPECWGMLALELETRSTVVQSRGSGTTRSAGVSLSRNDGSARSRCRQHRGSTHEVEAFRAAQHSHPPDDRNYP